MKYLLDTNTCIRYLNGRSAKVLERLDRVPESEVYVFTLVTHNTREFQRVPNLRLEDWEID